MTPSGPIRVKSGQHITGLHIVGDGGPAVRVEPGATGWKITGCKISAPAPTDGRPEPWRAVGIDIDGGRDFLVEDCEFDNCATSIYAALCTGIGVVRRNKSKGVRGPIPRGQFVQLNQCVGEWEIVDNESFGGPGVEDHINVFQSAGTSKNAPVLIARNVLIGGSGSESGSGICVGDGPGGAFVRIVDNRIALVNNAGIGIAGGTGHVVADNLIYQWGTTRESATSACLVIRKEASDVRSTGNRGIARSWVHGGNGELGAGYWVQEGGPPSVVSIDDEWQDKSLSLADVIGEREMPTNTVLSPADEQAIAAREDMLAAWRQSLFFEDMLAEAKRFAGALQQIGGAQLVAAQSVAKDAEQMRQAAEKAPAAQRASDIARDAVFLFADRYTVSTKGDAAAKGMADCVELARVARRLAEAP
jgi:hypothetical protein